MVGIVGAPDDLQVSTLARLLGDRAVLIDSRNFPGQVAMTIRPPNLRSVYVRQIHAAPYPQDAGHAALTAFREKGAFLAGWLLTAEEAGVRIVNSPRSDPYGNKPFQLALFRKAGLPVPDTLITNDPVEVRAFAARRERLIYKPVAGGATTRPLEARDLERLELLRSAPVLFQEYIPGENVRAYVVGRRLVSAAVIETTDAYDFRRSEGRCVTVELPNPVRAWCPLAAEACRLEFTSIDLRRDRDRWVFLEANTSPMWAGFDLKTDGKVGPALAEHLLA